MAVFHPFMQVYLDQFIELAVAYAPKVLLAIVVLVAGLWSISGVANRAERVMQRRRVDRSLRPFLKGLISISLKILLLLSVAAMVGIEVTSFVAVLAAAGFAVGLALQGSLGNFAGGVLILLFKPYAVGDYIEAQGHSGTVHEIQIFNTVLKTPDNKTVVIPNGPMSNGSVVNYSTEPTRRVDFTFGISYEDDIDKARMILERLVKAEKRRLKDPGHQILVGELADSSVNIIVRLWTKTEDYWPVFFDLTERTKKAFDKEGITIPYPQVQMRQ